MNGKHLIVSAALAAVMALASPANAGHLGGAGALGGGLGGNLGGNLSGLGGAGRLGGAGTFDSQGTLNGSISKKPVEKTTDKAGAAKSAASSEVAADASKSVSSASTAETAAAAAGKSAGGKAPAKPSDSTHLTGGADQSMAAGSHAVTAGVEGAADAQHSKGSTSAAADGSGSLN